MDKEIKVTVVFEGYIWSIWPKIVPLLEKGRKYWEDYYELEDIKKDLIKGNIQLWVGVQGSEVKIIMLTCIAVYPKAKYLRAFYMAGSGLKDCICYAKDVEKWAKKYGVVGWEGFARLGWHRRLRMLGFEFGKRADWIVRKFDKEE